MSAELPPSEARVPTAASFRLGLSVGLFALTCVSTTFAYAYWFEQPLSQALAYSCPLMAILLAHELGHYVAARLHSVPASLPYFVPVPLPPLGTMGAVILNPERIANRNALLDIGAAGPLAGMCVALPVLGYGIAHSAVEALPASGYLMEGRSLLFSAVLRLVKGPIAEGFDIQLSPTAFAGWAGLLVTMLNLIPALQLDGGHVACALLGERYERVSRTVRLSLLPLAAAVSIGYGLPAYAAGKRGEDLWAYVAPGTQWLLWWGLLTIGARATKREHPVTDHGPLSPTRRKVGWLTLGLFLLLFMPTWLRFVA
jgi:membrane-associated protease RseP (regulator of RpoE activity)